MEEITEYHRNRNNKTKVIIFTIITLVVLIGGVFGWLKYKQVKEEKRNEEYASILAETSVDMYVEFLLSSIIIGGYADVWDSAIEDGRDFNNALSDFHDGLSDKGLLKEREEGRKKIRDNMKLLQDPPKKYMESYIVIKQMFGTYSKMVEQALSPTGSLIEFNRKTNDLFSQFEQQKEELTITIPADVKKLKNKFEEKKKTENEIDNL